MPITKEQAEKAMLESNGFHQHVDCILIAGEWLEAQKPTKGATRCQYALKHMIESWADRYVSSDDVAVAAKILGIKGEYPRFHFDGRLIYPSNDRLIGIGEAGKHDYSCGRDPMYYYSKAE